MIIDGYNQPQLNDLVYKFFALPGRYLTRINFESVITHDNPLAMTETLGRLCELRALNDDDWNNIYAINGNNLPHLTDLIITLNASAIFNNNTLSFIVENQDIMTKLWRTMFFYPEIRSQDKSKFAGKFYEIMGLNQAALKTLACSNTLYEDDLRFIVTHQDLIDRLDQRGFFPQLDLYKRDSVTEFYTQFSKIACLNESIIEIIAQNQNPTMLFNVFSLLENIGIVDNQSWAKVALQNNNVEYLEIFMNTWRILNQAKNTDPANLQKLISLVISREEHHIFYRPFCHLSNAGILEARICQSVISCTELNSTNFDAQCAKQLQALTLTYDRRTDVKCYIFIGLTLVAFGAISIYCCVTLALYAALQACFMLAVGTIFTLTAGAILLANFSQSQIAQHITKLVSQNNNHEPESLRLISQNVTSTA